jgi:hypothetical protein
MGAAPVSFFKAADDRFEAVGIPGRANREEVRKSPYFVHHPWAGVTKNNMRLYRASQSDCAACHLKPRCCPGQQRRKVPRSVHEGAREVARGFADTPAYLQSRRERKKVEMLFAHLKRILRLGRLRLRGPRGAQDEFTLAAIAQNLRRLAKLVARPPPVASACLA